MRRRALLATLGSGLLAGCGSPPDERSRRRAGGEETPTYAGTTLSEPKPVPDPPETVTPESAEQFVRAYEEAVVYNELLPGGADESNGSVEVRPGGCVGAKSITVEEPVTRVVPVDGPGVYVVASVSGHVEHACPGSRSASGTRNRNFVTHYVGPDRHVAVPYNFYRCAGRETPYAGPDSEENVTLDADDDGYDEDAPAKIQLYNFHPDARDVAVWLTHVASGDRVLAETYTTDLPLTVVANLTVRTGTYRLVARLEGGTSVAHEFELTDPSAASWDGTCVYLTPQDELRAVTLETTEELGVPGSRCHESLQRRATTTTE